MKRWLQTVLYCDFSPNTDRELLDKILFFNTIVAISKNRSTYRQWDLNSTCEDLSSIAIRLFVLVGFFWTVH
jgi:hypothetical protein